jgi:hypothetical protein
MRLNFMHSLSTKKITFIVPEKTNTVGRPRLNSRQTKVAAKPTLASGVVDLPYSTRFGHMRDGASINSPEVLCVYLSLLYLFWAEDPILKSHPEALAYMTQGKNKRRQWLHRDFSTFHKLEEWVLYVEAEEVLHSCLQINLYENSEEETHRQLHKTLARLNALIEKIEMVIQCIDHKEEVESFGFIPELLWILKNRQSKLNNGIRYEDNNLFQFVQVHLLYLFVFWIKNSPENTKKTIVPYLKENRLDSPCAHYLSSIRILIDYIKLEYNAERDTASNSQNRSVRLNALDAVIKNIADTLKKDNLSSFEKAQLLHIMRFRFLLKSQAIKREDLLSEEAWWHTLYSSLQNMLNSLW